MFKSLSDDDINEIRQVSKCLKNKRTKKNIISKRSKSQPRIMGLYDDGNLLDISEKITNNMNSLNTIKDQEPQYLSQFECQSFDTNGEPGAFNDTYNSTNKNQIENLQNEISYDGGWSQYNPEEMMTYGVVPSHLLSHNNMTPYFSVKHGYGSNDVESDAMKDYKAELFTGNQSSWKNRKENVPLFKPMSNLTHTYGTPIYSEDNRARCIPGRYNQGQMPCDKISVTPGVNIAANDVGTHGYHSMYRPLDRTIDELRVKPKITYEGRVIEGMRGQKRTQQAPVISYRPDTYKTMTTDDILPSITSVTGPKTRDNFIMKHTDRADQHCEYTGGAYERDVARNIPEEMREKHRQSTKSNFILPDPMQKHSKSETVHNPNLNSYNLPFTLRDQTIHNNYIGNANDPINMYTPLLDVAKSTIRETMSNIPTNTHVVANTMRGTVHNMDIANTTLRETLVENPLNPHVTSLVNMPQVYNNDTAKPTLRETITEQIEPSNITNATHIYANFSDDLKTTMRETTDTIARQNFMTPVGQNQRAPNYTDIAKTTTRETTINIPYSTQITPINTALPVYNNDITRTTLRETYDESKIPMTCTPINQQQRAPNYSDTSRTTMRETTENTPYSTFTTPVGQQLGVYTLSDIAKTTTRETLPENPLVNFSPVNQHQRAPDNQDITRTTMRETTVHIPYDTTITPVDQYQRAPDLQDVARTTMREVQINSPWSNVISGVGQQTGPIMSKDANMKTTSRETTCNISRNTMISPLEYVGPSTLQDNAKTTMRELSEQETRVMNAVPINQHQGPNQSDQMRTTMRETTSDIPLNNMVTPVNQYQGAPNLMDTLKTTMREISTTIPMNTMITPVNQQQRMPDPTDITRTTMRETTDYLPRNTIVTAVDQYQSKTPIMDTMRNTMRETTCGTQRSTMVTPIGQMKSSPHFTDSAKTTTRETTCHIPYNTNITAVGQNRGILNNNDTAKTTMRETTCTIPYQPTAVTNGQYFGKASSFNYEPLKTTIREQYVDTPRNTNVSGNVHGKVQLMDEARTTTREQTIQIPYNTNITAVAEQRGTLQLQDIAKTTIKEQIVDIPRNTQIYVANEARGKADTHNGEPTKHTMKETIIDNNYIGATNGDISGKGYGYLTENMEAPNTNRQFTCQEIYINPAKGLSKMKSYNDAYNANITTNKENLQEYRAPTTCGVNMGPDLNRINIRYKNDANYSRDPAPACTIDNKLSNFKQISQSKKPLTSFHDRFIDPIILKQLETNPYHINAAY